VLCNILTMFVTMYAMCTSPSIKTLFWAAIIHGIFRSLLVVQTVHAASHFSFSHSPVVNRWVYRFGTVLIGLWAPPVWDIQHVVAHHIYTNVWPYDTDSAFPIKSFLPNQRRLWFHKYQHLYMWVVYTFTIPLVMLNSIRVVLTEKQMRFRVTWNTPGAKLEGYLCSLGSLIYVYLPLFFQPSLSRAFCMVLLSNAVSSLWFSLQFVVNHEVASVVSQPAPSKDTVDWGTFQMAESSSFSPNSVFVLETSGGLNTQIEHHLFPGVHYGHYQKIAAITQRVAKQFGLPYNYQANLWTALRGHYDLLKNPPVSVREEEQREERRKAA